MREANSRTKPWRATVVSAVQQQLPVDHQVIDGPVLLVALYTMPPPKRMPKTRLWPSRKGAGSGDEDKLNRAACDALTAAGVWADDSRVVRTISGSDYPGAPGFRAAPGCRLIVAPIEGDYLADVFTAWVEEILSAPAGLEAAR